MLPHDGQTSAPRLVWPARFHRAFST